MYRCPTCKSADHLDVVIETWARLIQDDDGENFQTDLDASFQHDHEWTDNSIMCCRNSQCPDEGDTQIAEYFEEPDAPTR